MNFICTNTSVPTLVKMKNKIGTYITAVSRLSPLNRLGLWEDSNWIRICALPRRQRDTKKHTIPVMMLLYSFHELQRSLT
jgi:hypothetical protein